MTLGVDPGTRFVGLAVVSDGILVHYQVRRFPEKWGEPKLRNIIESIHAIVIAYDVTDISVKIPDLLPDSYGYRQLIGSLNVMCERDGIRPVYHTHSKVKEHHCGGVANTIEMLMLAILKKFPELSVEYKREQRNKDSYYHKLFTAVAVATM